MMAEPFPPTVEDILDTFSYLEEWEERYEYLVEMGRKLPEIDAALKTPEYIVKGCMSSVWIDIDSSDSEQFQFQADSDSLIVRGLIVVLYSFYQGRSFQYVSTADPKELFTKLGFDSQLSSNRRNGLAAMTQRIRSAALEAMSAS